MGFTNQHRSYRHAGLIGFVLLILPRFVMGCEVNSMSHDLEYIEEHEQTYQALEDS